MTEGKDRKKPHPKGAAIGAGNAIGVGLGAALGNVGAGVAISLALGAAIEGRRKRDQG